MARQRKGILIVYTGDGKGKTTAAFGMAFRALGRGFRVAVIQFIKGKWYTGERHFAKKTPGIDLDVMGKGFTWESKDLNKDKAAAQKAWEKAKTQIQSEDYQIVILDEITYAINYGFINIDDVVSQLKQRPAAVTVVITGRNAPDEIVEIADLESEMTLKKHPYNEGHRALLGIDF
ncbi:MAG: cob(I)yrinic acid a,c-diamide adenosyltransferase [Pseudobacteriovorax sp.]|nr:cob(I)yrinic acid a,c-diamide adenosyltransferase [Pseudobacteriovorax sp.]